MSAGATVCDRESVSDSVLVDESPSLVGVLGSQQAKCGYCGSQSGSFSFGAWMHSLSVDDYEALIFAGWRRSGHYLYRPDLSRSCCQAWVIRLKAGDYLPSGSHKKVLKRLRRVTEPVAAESERAGAVEPAREVNGTVRNVRGGPPGKLFVERCNDALCIALHGLVCKALGDLLNDGSVVKLVSLEALLPNVKVSKRFSPKAGSKVEAKQSKRRRKTAPGADGFPADIEVDSANVGSGRESSSPSATSKRTEADMGAQEADAGVSSPPMASSNVDFSSNVALVVAGAERRELKKAGATPGKGERFSVGDRGRQMDLAHAVVAQLRRMWDVRGTYETLRNFPDISFFVSGPGWVNMRVPGKSVTLPWEQVTTVFGTRGPDQPRSNDIDGGSRSTLPGPTDRVDDSIRGRNNIGPETSRGSNDVQDGTVDVDESRRTPRPSVAEGGVAQNSERRCRDNDETFSGDVAKDGLGVDESYDRDTGDGQEVSDSSDESELSSGTDRGSSPIAASDEESAAGSFRAGVEMDLEPRLEGRQFAMDIVPSEFIEDEYQVYRAYQLTIHKSKEKECGRNSYRRFLVNSPLKRVNPSDGPPMGYGSFHIRYMLDGRLFAVGVVDVLPQCLSSVYLFYDPAASSLSPGVLSAIKEIDWISKISAKCPRLQFYIMGYYIHTCPKMAYKAGFKPSEILCEETRHWVPVSFACAKLDEARDQRRRILRLAADGLPKAGSAEEHEMQSTEVEGLVGRAIVVLHDGSQVPYHALERAYKSRLREMFEQLRAAISEYLRLVGRSQFGRYLHRIQ